MSKPAATASLARRHRSSIACSSAGAVLLRIEQHRQRRRAERRVRRQMAQLRHVLVVDDRVLDLDLPARLRLGLEQVALGPDRRAHVGHQLLADRVERRVRHLREQLLEVVVEQPRLVRQHGQRRVGAHRADRLLAVHRHRRDQEAQVLLRVAERLLPLEAPSRARAARRAPAGRSSMSIEVRDRATRGTDAPPPARA